MTDLAPQYDPKAVEGPLYQWWKDHGCFAPKLDHRSPYVIIMPPPNVTAQLHMGHGLNLSVQDVLVRFERMRGRDTLWVPGTDHAGIATQNVVEKQLAKEGKTRFDLGREAFLARVRTFVTETGSTILDQIRSLGASCDWDRTFYTFSDDLSRAVREVFVTLHEQGLIYRGKYIINWCPRCLTALSNEEAEKEEVDGRIWRLRYPLADGSGAIIVATTRPETMLGDTGVAVHPEDERYAAMIGKMVRLPLVDRLIPIVADGSVDKDFGTGAVKLTPAHDPLDFEIARRHDLPVLDVMTPEARMSAAAPERFQGLDRFDARKKVVAEFEAAGLLVQVDPHRHAVGHCYRCHTVVEPRLSDQWFVKMAPLAAPALEAHRDGTIEFVPERRGTEYDVWMEGIRDWCISRQIWWGHRIPVWYCEDGCGKITASRTDLAVCPDCGGKVRQDEDVLDTWFSSQLVPFSALGWPRRTEELVRFYPGSTLVTAPEILFFWVARMIMSGLHFMNDVPFTTVYLHGTVRDTQHRKMSKSLGNGIDPLDVVDKYGADALRFTVIAGLAVGNDVILDPEDLEASFATGRNFANKVWNVGRFILQNLDGPVRPLAGKNPRAVRKNELALVDRWIIARCEATVVEVTEAYERLRLNDAANAVYRFIWNDLADWYLEAIKPRLYGDVPGGDVARAVAVQTFNVALRLLHPVMPFITEALWRKVPGQGRYETIMLAPWPAPDRRAPDDDALAVFGAAQDLIGAIRSIRAEYNVQPGQSVTARVGSPSPLVQRALDEVGPIIQRMARLKDLELDTDEERTGASAVLGDGTAVTVPLGDLIDLQKEILRLTGEIQRLGAAMIALETKLANPQFVERAPAEVVARERDKLRQWRDQLKTLNDKLQQIG